MPVCGAPDSMTLSVRKPASHMSVPLGWTMRYAASERLVAPSAEREDVGAAEFEVIEALVVHRTGLDEGNDRRARQARGQRAAERRLDLGVRVRPCRGDLRAGEALERGGDLDALPRQRV